MAYTAIVAKLENVRKHENADRLQIASCLGYQVIVGLDAKDGDVVLLFPDDGQLSEEYAKANDLVSYINEAGEKRGGYFSSQLRVRAQTLRGVKSEAYVAGLNSLAFTGVDTSTITVGDRFTEINGVQICNKYITPDTLKAARLGAPKQASGYNKAEMKALFKEHLETDQLRHARDEELCGLVTITSKLHGTSGRSCLLEVPVTIEYTRLAKIFQFLSRIKLPTDKLEYKSMYGTRRVIKGEATEKHTDFRAKCHRLLQPHILKGETWYYEIVGYEDTGAPIMQTVSTDSLGKELRKQFGKTVTYKYGCPVGTCAIYVYRITLTTADGEVHELPWAKVKDKCKKAGIKHVPEVMEPHVSDINVIAELKEHIDSLVESTNPADSIDPSHPKEGVCVRIDNLDTGKMKIFKNKSFVFKVLEGIVKDTGAVDLEEVEAEQ